MKSSTISLRLVAAWPLLLTGCTGLSTQNANVNEADSGHARTGIHYFLPKARIKIVGEPSDDKTPYSLSITKELVADKEQRYRLVQTGSIMHDDTMQYQVNGSGLMDSEVKAKSDSKIEAISVNVVETGLNVIRARLKTASPAPAGAMAEAPDAKAADAQQPTLKPFEVNFDPYVQGEVEAARQVMVDAGFSLNTSSLVRNTKMPAKRPYRSYETGEVASSSEGIYYRPSTTVNVRVAMIRDDRNLVINQRVSIPDKDDVSVFRLSRGFFANTDDAVTFANGEPRKIVIDKKSEGAALTHLPLAITNKVLEATKAVPAVAQFFWKPKRDPNADIKTQTAALNAENARLKEENQLLQLKQENERLNKQAALGMPGQNGESGFDEPQPTDFSTLQTPASPSKLTPEQQKEAEASQKKAEEQQQQRRQEKRKRREDTYNQGFEAGKKEAQQPTSK